ncbi:MAG: SDR family oxidoreductase [Myxococcales bacterium]|nr:SDR family oxidoreductase [Myxococcales bacterium]
MDETRSGALAGKVCLITGANTGIGRATALELGRRGARLRLAGRSEERTQPVLDELRALGEKGGGADVAFIPLDLGSLASVRACAEAFLARDEPLHVLIANAGLAGARGQTEDGFERAFGVNHLGHHLLIRLLEETLVASAPSRIVIVSSKSHYSAKTLDLEEVRRSTRSLSALDEYAVSKLANVLCAKELDRRLGDRGVTAVSLHPGVVASDVWREVPWPFRSLIKLFMISNEEGARTTIHCATAPEIPRQGGQFFDRCRPRTPSPLARDEALARRLWEESEKMVGLA